VKKIIDFNNDIIRNISINAANKKVENNSREIVNTFLINGYSLDELAFAAGVSKKTIINWMHREKGDALAIDRMLENLSGNRKIKSNNELWDSIDRIRDLGFSVTLTPII
jgi:predicted DNA-binding protein YlxM (UPF0122 family)